MLGLADHAPFTRPARAGLITKVPEHARCLAAGFVLRFCRAELRGDGRLEEAILGQTKHIIDLMGFTPAHQILPAKPQVTPDQDAGLGPAQTDGRDNPRQFLLGAGRGILISAAQTGTQQLLAAEDVEWQVAVVAVKAVKETPFLVPVHWIVGRIHVQNDLDRRRLMGFQEDLHQQRIHRRELATILL